MSTLIIPNPLGHLILLPKSRLRVILLAMEGRNRWSTFDRMFTLTVTFLVINDILLPGEDTVWAQKHQ